MLPWLLVLRTALAPARVAGRPPLVRRARHLGNGWKISAALYEGRMAASRWTGEP